MVALLSTFSFCQVLRSSSEWSAGISKTESSIYEAMLYAIGTAQHYIYIENQFFITSAKKEEDAPDGLLPPEDIVRNRIGRALVDKIIEEIGRAHV